MAEKKRRGGRTHVPKTAAARKREIEKVERRRERLRRELAEAGRQRERLAAADRAAARKVRDGLERAAGRMLLDIIAEKRELAAAGDTQAQRNLDYWTGKLDRAVDDPAERGLAGLPPLDGGSSVESGPAEAAENG